MKQNLEYLVCYGGGVGPDVWDAEKTVTAPNIKEALQIAHEELKEECVDSWTIHSIEMI